MTDFHALARQIKVAAQQWLDPAVQKGLEAQDKTAPLPKLPMKPAPMKMAPAIPKKAAAALQQVMRNAQAQKPAAAPHNDYYTANPEGVPAPAQGLLDRASQVNPYEVQQGFGKAVNGVGAAANAITGLTPAVPPTPEANAASLNDNLGLGRQAANRAIYNAGQDKMRPLPPIPAPAPVPAAVPKKAADMNPERGGGGKDTPKILTTILKRVSDPINRQSAGEKTEKVAGTK